MGRGDARRRAGAAVESSSRAEQPLEARAAGVLLHPTSLPAPYPIGDLGPSAHAFAEFLARARQKWWQMLPIGPVGWGDSPYSAHSAFAGSPLLVSLDLLVRDGLLDEAAVERDRTPSTGRADYGRAGEMKQRHLGAAFEAMASRPPAERRDLARFRERNEKWLEDFALFMAIKRAHGGGSWTGWPPELRDRKKKALERAKKELEKDVDRIVFEQWVFDRQFAELRAKCRELGVGLIGDVPIFVAHDSADVWSNREELHIGEDGQPTVVAGVPPDYFSKTGQLWGNPLYRWNRMRKNGYRWWIRRLETTLSRFDVVRLDHFIGFYRCWSIPAGSPTAESGRWVPGPRAHFFRTIGKKLGHLPLIAEDLGAVTPEVFALRDRFRLPGIRVLQFAFGGDPSASEFLPHNYPRRAVVYTGTHDNDTIMGWFYEQPGTVSTRTLEDVERERHRAMKYLPSDGKEPHWDMIRCAWASVAAVAIVPAQDLLGLGTEARMNRPSIGEGNWAWRLREGELDQRVAERLADLTQTYGRG